MSNQNLKYGSGRNLWRKVYGYQNKKPQVSEIIDVSSNVTYSLDLNKTLRHRDFYIIKNIISETPVAPATPLAEYDEGLIHFFSISDTGTGSFNFTFSNNPIVVLTVESASLYGENVNIFGFSYNTSGFTFGLSAPFTGSIRYRAIYSPTYPAYATSSYSASITASAGSVTVTNQTYYTASFSALPGNPFKFLDTAWDIGTLHNVFLETQTSSSNSATVEISNELNSLIHFIAFYQ